MEYVRLGERKKKKNPAEFNFEDPASLIAFQLLGQVSQ